MNATHALGDILLLLTPRELKWLVRCFWYEMDGCLGVLTPPPTDRLMRWSLVCTTLISDQTWWSLSKRGWKLANMQQGEITNEELLRCP